MAIQEEVKIEVGQSVDVTLESSVGSTGYGWELAALEGNINLVGIASYPTASRLGAPVAQVFTFRGTAEGSGKAVFVLTAAWKIEEPKETVTYTFNVVKAAAADTDAFRLEGFTARAAVRAGGQPDVAPYYAIRQPAITPYYAINQPVNAIYSAPIDPCLCVTGNEDCCSAQPLYNVRPPVIEYGVRPPASSIQPLYAAPNDPCSCVTGNEECCNPPIVLRYNFPMMRYNIPPMMRYNIPPVMRYNFPDNGGCC